jgi:hypothetical protein
MYKNEELEQINDIINKELLHIQVKAQLKETFVQCQLLQKITLAEDNSSELAGFEINKLLGQ